MAYCQFCRTTDNPSTAGVCDTPERALTCAWLQGEDRDRLENGGATVVTFKAPLKPTVAALEDKQRSIDYWGHRCELAESERDRLQTAVNEAHQILCKTFLPLQDRVFEANRLLARHVQ